jgi:uncharacterized cupin superfamily protein
MPDMVTGTVNAPQLPSSPLRPEQILSGAPKTGALTLGVSPDGNLSFNLWDCTAGTFRWVYNSDEIIHVLDGGATITPVGGGPARTVKAGDVVYFPRGLVADWVVDNYIKKLAVHRSMTVSLRQRVTGKVKKLIKARLGA